MTGPRPFRTPSPGGALFTAGTGLALAATLLAGPAGAATASSGAASGAASGVSAGGPSGDPTGAVRAGLVSGAPTTDRSGPSRRAPMSAPRAVGAPVLDRIVCDLDGGDFTDRQEARGVCRRDNAARREGDPAISVRDVNQAYDNLGVTAAFYQQVLGVDLTSFIGSDAGDGAGPQLRAVVRACPAGEVPDCRQDPWLNAFWDGTGMVFGTGMATADDVVAHEMTHGVTDRVADLLYQGESGAISESLSDIFGELVDQWRGVRPGEDAATEVQWLMGENLPWGIGPVRDLKDPTRVLYGSRQPDRMSSRYWVDGSADNFGVHDNSGVGNRTGYLIAASLGIEKTAWLYWDTIHRLPRGATYVVLGGALRSSCTTLAASAAHGVTAADCGAVDRAVTATELTLRRVGLAPSAAVVTYGQSVRLTATVADARQRLQPNATVRLGSRTSSQRPFAATGLGRTTSAGSKAWSLTPRSTTRFEVSAPVENGSPWSAASGQVTVQVRPAMSTRLSASRVVRGRTIVVSGASYPTRPGGTVVLQRRDAQGWVTLSQGRLDAGSRFALPYRAGSLGFARLRVVRPAEATLISGAGPTVGLTVTSR